jgi:hypothetical protein
MTTRKRMSDAEVWAHPEAESIYEFIRKADYGPKWNPITRAMTRKQWTWGVREILEDLEQQEPFICDCCKAKLKH